MQRRVQTIGILLIDIRFPGNEKVQRRLTAHICRPMQRTASFIVKIVQIHVTDFPEVQTGRLVALCRDVQQIQSVVVLDVGPSSVFYKFFYKGYVSFERGEVQRVKTLVVLFVYPVPNPSFYVMVSTLFQLLSFKYLLKLKLINAY